MASMKMKMKVEMKRRRRVRATLSGEGRAATPSEAGGYLSTVAGVSGKGTLPGQISI